MKMNHWQLKDKYMIDKAHSDIMEILPLYQFADGCYYNPSNYAVTKILEAWYEAKKPILNWMRYHPFYDGNGRIVLTEKYNRPINKIGSREVYAWYKDIILNDDRFDNAEKNRVMDALYDLLFSPCQYIDNAYVMESVEKLDISCHKGAKTTRIVGKIARKYGFDKHEDYNKISALLGEYINPLSVEKKTVISVYPLDYYMMSTNCNFISCYTIDKISGESDGYHGGYSGGTQSYMLDGTTVILYTIKEDYTGDVSRAKKDTRQLFHIGEDKIIQSRLYPQFFDHEDASYYKTNRELMQKVYADSNGVSNYWINKKGAEIINQCAVCSDIGYIDIQNTAHFGNRFNVSFLAPYSDCELNYTEIAVGVDDTICPECGGRSSETESILCDGCYRTIVCDECGERINEDTAIYVNGRYFCDYDCAFSAGYVMDADGEFIFESDAIYCEDIGGYVHENSDWICTYDGYNYSSADSAMDDGYIYADDCEFHHESDFVTCENCGALILATDAVKHDGFCYCDDDCYESASDEVLGIA